MRCSDHARIAKERYLSSPLVVDTEYIDLYTKAHAATANEGISHPVERRAECHSRALESLTPTIFPEDELIVGRKTRFVRGAVPYCNYACGYILRELKSLQQEAQDSVTEVGVGGGIARGKELAAASGSEFATFGKKFLIRRTEVPVLTQCAEYWRGKCMQDVGERLWRPSFPQAEYVDCGWKAVLYTAAHDPAPEGRNILDFETALSRGLEDIARDCEERCRSCEVTSPDTAEKVVFWRAAARTLRATVNWAARYAAEARRLSKSQEVSAEARKRMERVAEICERVPANPPRDFEEAVQAFWFIYVAGHLEGAVMGYSPGRFDQYMLPYLRAGAGAPGHAMALLEYLRVKMTEVEYVASFAWEGLGSGNMFQNMILGGLTEDGHPGDNELSMMVVQSAINCKTTQPTLSVWHDPSLSDKFLMKCAECVKTGVGFPAWFNLRCYIQHELQATHGTLPLTVIRKYAAMGGCTEPTLGGMSYGVVQAGFVNLCKVFELALYGGVDPRTGTAFTKTALPQTLEELEAAFKAHLAEAVRNWQRYWNFNMAAHRQTCQLIYTSALTRDCIGRGKTLDDGGAVVNCTPTTLSTGLVNVANSFAAAKALVEEQKLCSMDQLRAALKADWAVAGGERLRESALAAPKWGNDDDRVDNVFVRLMSAYCEIVRSQKNYLGEPYDPSMLAISTHAPFGRACLATPDGRRAGQTLADGVTSPYPGTDVSGPFSVLMSAAKVDHTQIRGGLHNMKIHPSSLRGSRGSRKLLSLISSYFGNSAAFQLQFNVVDSRTLVDAQQHPENYRDLIVRVAGFSAYFVELSKAIQDEVIARTEHDLGGPSGPHSAEADTQADDEDEGTALAAVEGTVFDVQDFTLHDGPGVRTTVFLKGCPLRCVWCCNPESQRPDIEDMQGGKKAGRKATAGEIVQLVRSRAQFYQQTGGGGVTLSGGEPLAQPQFAGAICALLHRAGLDVAIETCGLWKWDEVAPVFKHLSLVYYDIKAATSSVHKKCTGADNTIILANLAHVVKAIGAQRVVVSVPIVTGCNAAEEEMSAIAKAVVSAGARKVRLLPYHPLGEHKYQQLGRSCPLPPPSSSHTPDDKTLCSTKQVFESLGVECSIVGWSSSSN